MQTLIGVESPLFARGIASALSEVGGFGAIVTVREPEHVVPSIRACRAQLAILDVGIGGAGPLLQRVRFAFPKLMIVTIGTRDWAHVALENGANGFVVRDAEARVFAEGVRRVLGGTGFTVVGATVPADQARLTARERQVLAGAGRGLTNAQIALELRVSVQTVKFHLGNVFRKLGVANRAQAAVAAIRLASII